MTKATSVILNKQMQLKTNRQALLDPPMECIFSEWWQGESSLHWKKKLSHFDLISWVTGGTKIRPGIPSNWRIFESNWLDIESQIDWILRVKLIRYWESIQIDSQYLVKYSPITYSESQVKF